MDVRQRIHSRAEALVEAAAVAAMDEAKRRVPVDTGALRSSIGMVRRGLSASVCADSPYAAHVELGSASRAPQPFLLPAVQAAREALVKEV